MVEQNIKVKVNVENNVVIDKTEEKKLCKILVAKGDKGQDGTVSFDELTEEQKASLKGEDGKGVPSGGKVGQILAKTSDDDYQAEWIDNNAEVDLTEYAKKEELPTKVSELENDKFFIENNKSFISVYGRLHVYNSFYSYSDRVDLSVGNLYGAESGGSIGTLYLNPYSDKDVSILHNGKEGGKLLYKNKEVATQEYVDEQIANIEVSGGDIDLSDYALKEELPTKTSELENDSGFITGNEVEEKDYATKEYVEEQISNIEITDKYELPIASQDTLGGIKVGANLTIDEDGTLNATASGSGEGTNTIAIDNLPIGSVVAFDGDEIPYGYEEVEDYMPTYSLEEKRVGTWIDGKPLYEKTIISTSKQLDLSDLNYDTLLIIYFGMYVSNYIMTPYYTSSSDYLKILVNDQKKLSMVTSHSSFEKVIVVVRYTKLEEVL